MYLGGTLIRQFDGFRRLCRLAAEQFGQPPRMPDGDLLLANRVLAALGGPPAAGEAQGRFTGDGLPLLLLFLLTHEIPCRVGLVGPESEPVMGRLKSLVHLTGHGVLPMLTGGAALSFDELVAELGPAGASLTQAITYAPDGDPTGLSPDPAPGALRTTLADGPFTLAVVSGAIGGAPPLIPRPADGQVQMHPAILRLT